MDDARYDQAAAALIEAGVTGPHRSHSRRNMLEKISGLVGGDSTDTFGLAGAEAHTVAEVLGFMSELTGCGADPGEAEGYDQISPEVTIAGLVAAGRRLGEEARRGATLVAATGHPTGMLETYQRIVDAYRAAGGKLLRPREGEELGLGRGRSEVRYVGGVGCLADWGALHHTHSAAPMEAMLDSDPRPDIVLGDHGFAGAALQRGIAAVAVMDINDPALAVAWAHGKDVVIVPLDDNRLPVSYEPAWRIVQDLIAGEEAA